MPILSTDNEVEAVDLTTADEQEVVEVAKVKSKGKAASKAPSKKAAVRPVAKKAPPVLKPASGTKAAKAAKKIVAKNVVKKHAKPVSAKPKPSKSESHSGGKSRGGKKRGWPTGVGKGGKPVRALVLKLLKQRLSPSEVAKRAKVTPQRVYQIRKTA